MKMKQDNYQNRVIKNPIIPCEYKDLCPPNIPKYSMKCDFNKEDCQVRKYFKRLRGLDLTKLGIGS